MRQHYNNDVVATHQPDSDDVIGNGDGYAVDDRDEPDNDDDGAMETRAGQSLTQHRVDDRQVALHRDHRQDDDRGRVTDGLDEVVQLTHRLQHVMARSYTSRTTRIIVRSYASPTTHVIVRSYASPTIHAMVHSYTSPATHGTFLHTAYNIW